MSTKNIGQTRPGNTSKVEIVPVLFSHVIGISMVATALRLDSGSAAVKENGLLQGTILEIGSFGGYKISRYFAHQRYKFDRGPQNVTLM